MVLIHLMYNESIENEINPVTRWKNEFSKQKYGKRQIPRLPMNEAIKQEMNTSVVIFCFKGSRNSRKRPELCYKIYHFKFNFIALTYTQSKLVLTEKSSQSK